MQLTITTYELNATQAYMVHQKSRLFQIEINRNLYCIDLTAL